MGWFFSANKYSTQERYLSEADIKQLVSTVAVSTLKSHEAALAETEIIKRRGADGKISLQQIYEVLRRLKHGRQLSQPDVEGLMKLFEAHFGLLKH